MRELETDYDETLRPPLSWWAMAAALVAAVWWCFFVATPLRVASIAAGVAAVAVAGALVRYGAVRITTDAEGLRAGRAVLSWRHVGAVEALDSDRLRGVLGVDADARAHLLIRPYCRQAVKVAVDDDGDPTPYWVVSTRRADDLARHLRPRSRHSR